MLDLFYYVIFFYYSDQSSAVSEYSDVITHHLIPCTSVQIEFMRKKLDKIGSELNQIDFTHDNFKLLRYFQLYWVRLL